MERDRWHGARHGAGSQRPYRYYSSKHGCAIWWRQLQAWKTTVADDVTADESGPDAGASSLDDIGLRFGVKQASNKRDLLRQHEQVIRDLPHPITDVVLILGVHKVGTANTFAEFLPDASIHLLAVGSLGAPGLRQLSANVRYVHCATIAERVRYLTTIPRPQLIIENGNNLKGQKLACFQNLFLFLPPAGVYVVEETKATTIAKLDDFPGENIVELLNRLNIQRLSIDKAGQSDDVELARSIDTLTFGRNVAYIRKAGDHKIKLRERDANDILDKRFGSSWGSVVASEPGYEFDSATNVVSHGAGPAKARRRIKVPDRFLRLYHNPVCDHRQRVSLGDYYLPDTFRHPLQSRLNHRELVDASPYVARIKPVGPAIPSRQPRRLAGSHFYFDTEYPGHFGHVMTEVLGRYWGWQRAVQLAPDVKPLVSVDPGMADIPDYQKLIFEALDVPLSGLVVVQPGEPVQVERLYAATPGFAMPHYADKGLADVWAKIGDRLVRRGAESPDMIFSSRRPQNIRSCLNVDEVEEFFAGLGFSVIYPEDHSLPDQVTMFSRARLIAGFGGSNMFCTMFAPRTPKIIISGDSYTANNEQLISSVVGGDIHYVWGDSEVKHPSGGWTWPAFQSNFRLDLDRVEREVKHIVDDELAGWSRRVTRRLRRGSR